MLLGDFLVSLLVALGLSILGDLRRRVASRIFNIYEMARLGKFRQFPASCSEWLKRPLLYH
jgi:hypothetical protein